MRHDPISSSRRQPAQRRRPPTTPDRSATEAAGFRVVLPDMVSDRASIPDDVPSEGPRPGGRATERHDPCAEVMDHPFWIQASDSNERISIPAWVLDLVTEANEILVLGQVSYWFGQDRRGELRAGCRFDDHLWLAKSYGDLGREVHREARQIQRAVRRLQRRGFLIVVPRASSFYGGQVVSHFRIDWDRVAAAHRAATLERSRHGDDTTLL